MNIKKYIPKFVFKIYHFILAFLGALFYGFPSKKIKVIGITGTSGKSTTVNICDSILRQGGFKVASMSSIRFKFGEEEIPNELKMTMPGRLKIQKFLKGAVKRDCDYAIIEVTSEGIEQFRHKFINFEVAIFTNLSPEHIESHGSFENYMKAKGKFFKDVKKVHILNKDDEHFEYFNSFSAIKKITYSIINISDFKAKNVLVSKNGSDFYLKDVLFKTNLLGEFNVYNSLAGIALGQSQGISLEDCKQGLLNAKNVSGRMEKVISEPFSFYIDYALTPVALEKVYKYLNPDIVILGACGGGRDKWKRVVFGKLASKYAQTVIITNEDPYDEDPEAIIDDVLKGVGEKGIKIIDRRDAIKKAIEIVKPGQTIVITGKGSETCIMEKGVKKDWNEKQVILEEYKKRAG